MTIALVYFLRVHMRLSYNTLTHTICLHTDGSNTVTHPPRKHSVTVAFPKILKLNLIKLAKKNGDDLGFLA